MKFEFTLSQIDLEPHERLITKRGLQSSGRVQQFIDNEVLRRTDPYVPFDTGVLKDSGIRHTKIGSGEVRYRTPYARKMYYGDRYTFQGGPMRGARWFERMKADHKDNILNGAKKTAGAK